MPCSMRSARVGVPFSGVEILADTSRQNAWLPYYGLDLWWCHPKLLALLGSVYSMGIAAMLASVLTFAGYRLVKIFSEDTPIILAEEM